jgi:hypothetical protein
MVYIGSHYGSEWFITRKGLKGLYIRFVSHPDSIEIRNDEITGMEDWKESSEPTIRLLIKYLFRYSK